MRSKKVVNFISGHLDITQAEFDMHYRPSIDRAMAAATPSRSIAQNEYFVVGDARGADTLAQQYLWGRTEAVVVYHMFTSPRNNPGFSTRGGFQSDVERDTQMTLDSDRDIAWVRPGREKSGTQANCNRRSLLG
ncbi:hypothetical protein [Calothrix sp. PCC 6303]|uniref:hypothetical protein n=1 Tax=Calothrix sp. PCC 6303 TaxID=1170562 RepID=UPI0002A037CF|nr:hypothetical protein [Calothrix sp. PCC 6303]AFZ01644.1 hypothetical protein Cal6303_2671 [Calothrix sp. PCC 6303]